MATDSLGDMSADDQGLPAPGAALLLVIGEPFSDDHKTLILAEITKGFKSWDTEETGIDINEELAQIANRASLGEEGSNVAISKRASGERVIVHQSDNLAVEILVNPQTQTVRKSLKGLLTVSSPVKYLLYAGHAFQGSGAWVLQDDTFSFANLAQVFKCSDVENALKQNMEASLTIHTVGDNDWGNSISKADFAKNVRIQLNPPEKIKDFNGVLQFTAYIGSFVKVTPVASLLQASEAYGSIRFSRPTLYIFPGCQGDSSLFGISGFNLLINGGYNRKACFWEFTRHLDRIDAVLLTHLGTDNVFGISSVLQRKAAESIHPEIGYMYLNAAKLNSSNAVTNGDAVVEKDPSLLINLSEAGNQLSQLGKALGISPQPCSRGTAGQTLTPINLYHKLGHGTLDMYVLNPITDSKELKDFYQQWNKQVGQFGESLHFPLQNMLSVCTMLVWKPHNLDEKIVRLFFPGNAPQHKVVEGLEKMKTFAFLKHPVCSEKDLQKPASNKAGAGKARPASASARPTSAATKTTTRVESPKKPEPKTPLTRTSPLKATKVAKEDNNKKTSKSKEKEKVDTAKEKESKAKSSASSSPSKSSQKTTSPRKTPSPVKSVSSTKSPSPPKAASPAKTPSPVEAKPPPAAPKEEPFVPPPAQEPEPQPVSNDLVDISPEQPEPLVNHCGPQESKPEADQMQALHQDQVEALQSLDGAVESESPEPLPEPEDGGAQPPAQSAVFAEPPPQPFDPMTGSMSSAVDAQKLAEYGIYEDDQDGYEYDQQGGGHFNGSAMDEDDVRPQALPDPVAVVESPREMESDALSGFIADKQTELDEFSKVEEELKQAATPEPNIPQQMSSSVDGISFPDVAEKEQMEFYHQQQDLSQPPAFHDEPEEVSGHMPVEQNIQYGIDDSNQRAMGGIQEVDEEEVEDVNKSNITEDDEAADFSEAVSEKKPSEMVPEEEHYMKEDFADETHAAVSDAMKEPVETQQMDKETLREMGIYDEDEEEEERVVNKSRDSEVMEELDNEAVKQEEGGVHVEKEQDDEEKDIDVKEMTQLAQDHAEEAVGIPQDQYVENDYAYEKEASPDEEEIQPQNLGKAEQMPFEREEADEEEEIQPQNLGKAEQMPFEREELDEEEEIQPQNLGKAEQMPFEREEADEEDEIQPQNLGKAEQMPFEREDEEEEIQPQNLGKAEQMPYEREEVDGEEEIQPQNLGKAEQMPFEREYEGEEDEDEEEKYGSRDDRTSTERQFEDVDGDEGIHDIEGVDETVQEKAEDASSLPAAFERDLTPGPEEEDEEMPADGGVGYEKVCSTHSDDGMAEKLPESTNGERDDTDSIDGGTPDSDKDIDETFAQNLREQERHEQDFHAQDMYEQGDHAQDLYEQNLHTQKSPADISPMMEQMPAGGAFNPFMGIEGAAAVPQGNQEVVYDSDREDEREPGESFDPVASWGQPMGLPAPPPPETKAETKGAANSHPKKSAEPAKSKRPSSGTTKPPAKTSASADLSKTSRAPRPGTAGSDDKKAPTSRTTRPATAPAASRASATRSAPGGKRPATAGSRSSPPSVKMPPLPPMTAFYMDLTYIPSHGNPSYCDVEFFKRVRARNYVLSALSPNPQILNALLEAKQTWEQKDLEVTIIPTYDNETLRHWMGLHKDQLEELHIELAPSVNRCTIQLQDLETSLPAYRLEF